MCVCTYLTLRRVSRGSIRIDTWRGCFTAGGDVSSGVLIALSSGAGRFCFCSIVLFAGTAKGTMMVDDGRTLVKESCIGWGRGVAANGIFFSNGRT